MTLFVPIPETGDPYHFWTRFHCLSREAKGTDCCFDRYKSRARSFRSSCVIQCGSLPLVPEYVDPISSKDIYSAESSLEGISSSDEKRRSLFTGGVATGRSSEWGTSLIADRMLGYLIFFLEDALKPVKQKITIICVVSRFSPNQRDCKVEICFLAIKPCS